ncbi:hypothetical protein TREMEDRAFT_74725 [Tremella mesenterica DSM 1558]|uniref:uncharacterized protein n=1 Tax=Tremella mesenterica (strain ATCC 24925 / CBS 8224 / DSM 1558 / NBRC 9311 / NRRL Y-6157 / RJB 2259-6 / UBC 559-6) TaxID=578456 RepID=UPI00032C6C49|nr:uncharacterized protein TREMEDRAFT_74725 [Tremella mesenterica DSM 1558]EIW66527.1 hypothetical protein TREMEDRAFT_74725 [Tremella mesenterica DSM 1558]
MFNSPAPRHTPRRGGSLAPPSIRRGTPSVFSERDRDRDFPLTPSVRSSRLPPIRRVSPTSSAGDTIRTARHEVEQYEKVYWSKDATHAVSSAGPLPREVQQLVKGADLVVRPLSGSIDPQSGFAFIASSSTCISWNYAKGHGASAPPVISALYHGSNGSEPGMILVSPTGEMRIWESMNLALANVDRFQRVELELEQDDFVQKIWEISAFRLNLTSSAGRCVPSVTPLTKSGGIFGRTTASIFGSREDREGVVAVTSSAGSVFMMAQRTLQKWALGAEGQKYLQEYDLHDAVGQTLYGNQWSPHRVHLELNDLLAFSQEELAVLVSYSDHQSGSGSKRIHNSHAIVLFSIHPKSNALTVDRIVEVSYLAHPDPRMLDVPRLSIPSGSPIAFIRFADVIVMVSMLPDSPYEDVIVLKESHRNAFLGVGCRSGSAKHAISPSLIVMPAIGGLLTVEVFEAADEALSQEMTATARLKSKMEQAVFFGDRSENPLSFDLPAGFKGDPAEAALAVSAEVLASSSPYMPTIFELRPQLSDRLLREKELIRFVRSNGLLSMLPQTTRRALSRDAEKIKASIDLWDHQNRLMDHMIPHSPQSLLSDAITAYMSRHDSSEDGDVVRLFFRSHLHEIDSLLTTVVSTFRAATSSDSRMDLGPWVEEVNNIFISVNRAASQLREDEHATYEIDRLRPASELWTAQDALIDSLDGLYSITEGLIRDRTRDLGSVVDEPPSASSHLRSQQEVQAHLKRQMVDLAAALCTNMEEKMRAAKTREMDKGVDPKLGASLAERWAALKPRVIRPLGYQKRTNLLNIIDYSTLVYLCHQPKTTRGQVQLQTYIERFGEVFAFVLYEYYIEQGQLHALLSQDEVYGHLLTKFFDQYHYPELAWMHHIACKRFGEAAASLHTVATTSQELVKDHLASSIAKLAAVAEIKTRGPSQTRVDLLSTIDDELELVKVQNDLRESLRSDSTTKRGSPSIENFVVTNCKGLENRPAFKALFIDLGRRLLEGKALDVEGLIDALTLKDNHGSSAGDSAVALDRLTKSSEMTQSHLRRDLPEGRKEVALISIWRRVFIQDDWLAIARTAGRSEKAQRGLQRQTLTYATVRALGEIKDFPSNYIISPLTATQPPLLAEVAARFPERPAGEIEMLMRDHEDEIRTLQRYMNEAVLEERVKEVVELVREDTASAEDVIGIGGEDGEGDVEM